MKIGARVFLIVCWGLLSACGKSGPLYLPKPPAAHPLQSAGPAVVMIAPKKVSP